MKRSRIRRSSIRQLRPGEAVPAHEPRRYSSSHGYVRLRWKVDTQQYVEVYEHRVVDGVVTTAEHVHHHNHTKSDNSSENLVPLTAEQHNALHADERRGRRKYGEYRSKNAKEKAQRAQARRAERKARAAEMRRLYLDEKLTIVEIGERFGVHHSNVSRDLRAAGVVLNPGGHRGRSGTGPEARTRQLVTARACLSCERCGTSVKWTPHHIHHRKPRGMGGSSVADINSPANLLLLCPPCHLWVESNRTTSYEQGWLVHRAHDSAQVPVWIAGREFVFLTTNGNYETKDGEVA